MGLLSVSLYVDFLLAQTKKWDINFICVQQKRRPLSASDTSAFDVKDKNQATYSYADWNFLNVISTLKEMTLTFKDPVLLAYTQLCM